MIRIRNLTKRLGEKEVLRNLSCRIPTGCLCGVAGADGAGKSTLLRLLAGVYRPDGGEILFQEQPEDAGRTVRDCLVFVPDEPFFLPGADMKRMAKLYASLYRAFDAAKLHELSALLQIDEKVSIATLSKGKQRAAALALALATGADILILDEVLDGIDPVTRAVAKKLLLQPVLERHGTVILTSHSLHEMGDICDRLIVLHDGELLLQRDVQDLMTSMCKFQIAFTSDFDARLFAGLEIVSYIKRGSVAQLVVRGDFEAAGEYVMRREPVLLDELPLTLEEIYNYELQLRTEAEGQD